MYNKKSLIQFYHAFGESHIKYGIIIWGNNTQHKRIFIIQKRIMRKIFSVGSRETCKETFKKQRILTYYAIYYIEIVLNIHKQKELPQNSEKHTYNTRQAHHIQTKYSNTKYGQNSAQVFGIRLYNALPDNLKSLNYQTLKQELIKNLKIKAPYNFKELDKINGR